MTKKYETYEAIEVRRDDVEMYLSSIKKNITKSVYHFALNMGKLDILYNLGLISREEYSSISDSAIDVIYMA